MPLIPPSSPQHYLVTGGAGFIGSHLCQRLLDAGNHVTALDDLSTGAEANIAPLRARPGFWFVRDSVENQQTVNLLVSRADRIFHLAAAVGVQLVANEPIRTIRTTVHGTEVVLEAASRYNRPTLITSSSEVYGKGTRVPFAEDDDVVMAATSFSRWCYAYSKGIDEFLGLAYFKQYGLPVVLARLFNTVGPRQTGMYGMVLPRFAQAALANQPLQVYGDGNQTRCFCHVADVVDALIALLARATPKQDQSLEAPATPMPNAQRLTPGANSSSPLSTAGQVFNVGGDEEISMNDLASRVIALADSSSTIQHISYEQAYGQKFDDMMRRVPKLDKIKSAIGFSRRFMLDQIVRSVLDDRRGRE